MYRLSADNIFALKMMNQTIQQTTQKLINLLPENEEYYRLDELRSWGFPPFIVQRIQVELERNLAESMIPPKTDWANTQSDAVLEAWQQFVQAIRAEARLPASYAQAVIETAVADTLDMLIEPRKNIADVIFGSDDELDYDQLCDRIKAVVVYPHFAALVPRYMQKKELDTLSRDRCDQLIGRADERLTANYSPLNWAQTLDPLFNLLDEDIDPSILRLFFEDKEREQLAEVFDQKDEALSRAEFIEVLSDPDLIETKEIAVEEESETNADKEEKEPVVQETDETTGPEDQQKVDERDEEEPDDVESIEESGEEYSEEEEDEEELTLNTGYADFTTSEPSNNGDDSSLNTAFGRDEQRPLVDFDDTENEQEEVTEEAEEQEVVEPSSEWDEPEEEDNPIWMNFMSEEDKKEALAPDADDEAEDSSTVGFEQWSSEEDDDGFIDEPIIDLTDEGDNTEEEVKKLEEQLAGARSRFVKDIFGGSERAYEGAIEEIATLSNWRGASRYIQKEVFQRNMVDMYSESAIDFTDRLQSYFSAKEN